MGYPDDTNAFDMPINYSGNISDCFQLFKVAHSLTNDRNALELATALTLKEFDQDGCCYLELRSTPRESEKMTKMQYIETLIKTIRKMAKQLQMVTRLLLSIDRSQPVTNAEEVTELAIKYHNLHPDIVVGLELSGNPTLGQFNDFVPSLTKAREAGLKISLHCAEIINPTEVLEMLEFSPERIGHGTCIAPRLGGTDKAWSMLCSKKIPVEICQTSNVNTGIICNYESHPFKEMQESNVPVIICTDDKGVFSTSLSQEYRICAETFHLTHSQLATLAVNACNYIFSDNMKTPLADKLKNFLKINSLK